MRIKKIKISENIYNGVYGEGSVFENSINIVMSQDIFGSNVEKLTNDSILSAYFRRSFMDNNLNLITVEIPLPFLDDIEGIVKIVGNITNTHPKLIKGNSFNLQDYLNKITIVINDSDEYEILKDDKLAQKLLELSKMEEMIKKDNREIIDSINI